MARPKFLKKQTRLEISLDESDKKILLRYSKHQSKSVSELFRDWIKTLKDSEKDPDKNQ